MRSTLTGLTLASLVLLGCSREPSGLAAEQEAARAGAPAKAAAAPEPEPELEEPALASPQKRANAAAGEGAPGQQEPELGASEVPAPPARPPAETPEDPLAPVLPSGPEPGSPEADAELAELLEESTISQEEFDRAFRGGGPQLDGDQFVLGPGTRARPVVRVGQPRVREGSLDPAAAKARAEAELGDFVGCYALASKDAPGREGSIVLRLRFGADASVASTSAEGGAGLGSSLRDCLASVPADWKLPGAAGATLELPLSLSAAAQ